MCFYHQKHEQKQLLDIKAHTLNRALIAKQLQFCSQAECAV